MQHENDERRGIRNLITLHGMILRVRLLASPPLLVTFHILLPTTVLSKKQYIGEVSRYPCARSFRLPKAMPLQRQINLSTPPCRFRTVDNPTYVTNSGTKTGREISYPHHRHYGEETEGIRNADGLSGRHVILVRWFVTFGIHRLRALGGARCVPTTKAGDSLSSPVPLPLGGRSRTDGWM